MASLKRREIQAKTPQESVYKEKQQQKRPLGIPNLQDRAMQALYLMAPRTGNRDNGLQQLLTASEGKSDTLCQRLRDHGMGKLLQARSLQGDVCGNQPCIGITAHAVGIQTP
ncbi:MAG: hypothetical protein WCZ43_09270 [Proteiniphilum sp.]